MQLFLRTATGRGLWEWIGSHGELRALTYAGSDPAGDDTTLRYRARLGEALVGFSITVTKRGEIAQIYWW